MKDTTPEYPKNASRRNVLKAGLASGSALVFSGTVDAQSDSRGKNTKFAEVKINHVASAEPRGSFHLAIQSIDDILSHKVENGELFIDSRLNADVKDRILGNNVIYAGNYARDRSEIVSSDSRSLPKECGRSGRRFSAYKLAEMNESLQITARFDGEDVVIEDRNQSYIIGKGDAKEIDLGKVRAPLLAKKRTDELADPSLQNSNVAEKIIEDGFNVPVNREVVVRNYGSLKAKELDI